jgi:hypothetical protein
MGKPDTRGQPHAGWPKGKRRQGPTRSQQHGHHALKTTLQRLGSRALDPDTDVGRELAAWRASLIADLGGEENLTTSERALVDLAVRDRLLLDSVDAWLLAERKLVNGRKKSVYPAVAQRMKLAEGYTRRLQTLGLQRRQKPVPSLQEYLKARVVSDD